MNIFTSNVIKEDLFKPVIQNEGVYAIGSDIGVRVVNFVKFAWTSLGGKTRIDHIFIHRSKYFSLLSVQPIRATDCGTDRYLVVAKVRARLAVSAQRSHRFQSVQSEEMKWVSG
jgi:hypothetical protein